MGYLIYKEERENMNKVRFAIVGYGWRAATYFRIARLCREHFEVTACVVRSKERAAEVEAAQKALGQPVTATDDLDEALSTKPDFVLLCISKPAAPEWLIRLIKKNVPVLIETPPATSPEKMVELWKQVQELGGRVQVAEQYFLQPYYASVLKLIEQDTLGEVSNVSLSAIHDYHAVSIFRKILGIGFENCVIQGKKFSFPVAATFDRGGFVTEDKINMADRKRGYYQFDNGKVAFQDFGNEQYFSPIRTRRWNIQGTYGEITDMMVRTLNKEHLVAEQPLQRMDLGLNNIAEWSHKAILYRGKTVYENPFYPARLNDDEIAMATCLAKMKEYAETGKEFYSLAEGMQDAYLAQMLDKAMATGETIHTETQIWAK